jgi:hypothetical protein
VIAPQHFRSPPSASPNRWPGHGHCHQSDAVHNDRFTESAHPPAPRLIDLTTSGEGISPRADGVVGESAHVRWAPQVEPIDEAGGGSGRLGEAREEVEHGSKNRCFEHELKSGPHWRPEVRGRDEQVVLQRASQGSLSGKRRGRWRTGWRKAASAVPHLFHVSWPA